MQFIDLKAQYRLIEKEIKSRINSVLEHGRFIMGPEIGELEEELASFADCRHVVTCSSGTDALLMALLAYGVGPKDAVFTTPFTFIATAEAIVLAGATPVFVDIDPDTYNIDPKKLEEAISRLKKDRTELTPKGIIGVDIFGLCADYSAINHTAKQNNLFVIEDAAQSFGASYKGRRSCSLADVGATSFFPAKPLGCYGDGGAVFTNDDELAEKLRSIRIHGQGSDKYDNVRIGINGRMDTLQAAILLPKLALFEKEIEMRNKVADYYTSSLNGCVKTPHVPDGYRSVWAQYSILADNRREIMDELRKAGIPTAIYYQKPLHLQGAFKTLGYGEGDYPVSENISRKIFSLPMHPYLKKEDQEIICEIIRKSGAL